MSNINHVNPFIDNNFIRKNSNTPQHQLNPLDLQKNFLNLLITQIKNQDPTDPIKNTELTSQLAQINTATGIERLNNTVGNFSNQINQTQNIQVSSLIGHHVMIPNNQVVHTKDTNTKFAIELIGNATTVKINITDKKGKILYIKTIKNIKPGIHHFIWNGQDLNKNKVNTDKYNILVIAKNKDKNVPVESLSEALVHSVITTPSGDPLIDLGVQGNIMLSEIREILK